MRVRPAAVVLSSVLFIAACTRASDPAPATPPAPNPSEPTVPDSTVPPATPQDRMEHSSRHAEWVDVQQGDRSVRSFLVFPEVKERAPAVIVIHENRGLTDWVRSVADRLAEEGFVAIAPDLLSGTAPDGGGTAAFANSDAARDGIYALPPDQVTADLAAVFDHVKALPASDGTVAVIGFCWGGSQTFRFATNRADVRVACVFYGTAPEKADDLARITCPVYGFYAEDDARVNATLAATTAAMAAAGRTFDQVTYPGAGHAFLRYADAADASPANRDAAKSAWERLLGVLRAK